MDSLIQINANLRALLPTTKAELFKIPLVGEELGSSVLYVGLGYSAPYKRKSVSAAFIPDS